MNKKKLPSLISLLILTLITAIMWVGLSIYRAFVSSPNPSVSKAISQPLNPSLDSNTVNQIESSLFFDQSQIPNLNLAAPSPGATAIPQSSPATTETPVASSSASPTISPTASPSATPTTTP